MRALNAIQISLPFLNLSSKNGSGKLRAGNLYILNIKLSLLLLSFINLSTFSQEVKKIVNMKEGGFNCEEYYVLKEDRSLKHGTYLKYDNRLGLEKYIREFGSFDHNRKTGVWFYFNSVHFTNPLSIIGEYNDDLKTGTWYYFYPPELKDSSAVSLLGFGKITDVIEPKKKGQDCQIIFDTTGLKLAAMGNFENNQKTGTWSYYSKDGRLVKEYDFTGKKQVFGIQNDSTDFYGLGGLSKFQEHLAEAFMENNPGFLFTKPSKVKLEIITVSSSLYINNLSSDLSDPLGLYLEYCIKNMPADWIDYDSLFEKFSFIIELEAGLKENGFIFNTSYFTPGLNRY